MGYTLKSESSLETMIAYADRVTGALLAQPETQELAPAWEALLAQLDQMRANRDRDERLLGRASAVFDVRDAKWDSTLLALSGEAFHASGKKADQLPYSRLFQIKAAKATHFGPTKATTYAADLLSQAAVLNHPALASFVEAFRMANDALLAAHSQEQEAARAFRNHGLLREQVAESVQALMDTTEYELLKRFPGDESMLRAILSPYTKKRAKETDSSTGDPETSSPSET